MKTVDAEAVAEELKEMLKRTTTEDGKYLGKLLPYFLFVYREVLTVRASVRARGAGYPRRAERGVGSVAQQHRECGLTHPDDAEVAEADDRASP